ncbi:TIGR01777 family oxidoreductase [Lapillicoccus sp.]|uniref:TIGR01777 family oxidoreductase n=1 Tax=Lapillicoccus sp. TaxID=1909287 RepID=UPI0032672A35
MSEAGGSPGSRRVVITGASGLIGSALSTYLVARGDRVVHLVRREARTASEVEWDPTTRHLDPGALEGVDVVVHLAGAGVADKRWTADYKQLIVTSRTDSTTAVATAVAAHGSAVRLVNASAVGFYGTDRGDEVLTEDSPAGEGFLAEVVQAWESATDPASAAGAPVAMSRTGLVMSRGGGAFAPLVRLGRLGLAGSLGSGKQYWPWITLDDVVRALVHLVDHREVVGPVNVVGPDPMRQKAVVDELGRQLGRPTVLPAPAFALRIALGEFSSEVLGSQRVVPTALQASGFEFVHGDLASAVTTIL